MAEKEHLLEVNQTQWPKMRKMYMNEFVRQQKNREKTKPA
jgi:hypothetical protein